MSLKIINNILSDATINHVSEHSDMIYKNQSSFIFKNNFKLWNQKIIEFSKEVLIFNLDVNTKEYKLINDDLKKLNLNKRIKAILYYYWLPGSYIPWHTDGSHSNTLTIYLNNEWDYKWGGLFNYEDSNKIETIIPTYNIGVLQVGEINHSTTITNKLSPIRKTIQIFFDNEDINYDLI